MRKSGFTLIEILIVLAFAGAALSLSLHTYKQLSERRLLAQPLAALVKTLRFARSAAIGGGHAVTVCPSEDGVSCAAAGYERGWIVFTETDGGAKGVRDAGERVLAVRGAFDSRLSLRSNAFTSHLTFDADGRIGGGRLIGGGRFVVCADRDLSDAAGVFVIRSGRLRVARTEEIEGCLVS